MKINTNFNSISQMLKSRGLDKGGTVQKYVDSEVLRRSDPYVPMQTGALKKSGITGTVIGKGEVIYNAPHAKQQYYRNAGNGKQGTSKGGLRGKLWFVRMKCDHIKDILAKAKEKAGGK